MGVLLRLGDEVGVVGDQRREAHLPAQVVQLVLDALLDGVAVVHDLEEVVVGAEDVAVVAGGLVGRFGLAEAQAGLDLAGGAAGGGDDAFGVLGDELAVHAGLVVVALEGGDAGEAEEVAGARGVLGDHGHVRVGAGAGEVVAALAGLAPEDGLLVEAVVRGEVGLDAEDGFDAGLLGRLVEGVAAVHVAVVGHGDGWLAEPFGLGEQGPQFRCSVEHRVLGVHVEMDELLRHEMILLGAAPMPRITGFAGPAGRGMALLPALFDTRPPTARRAKAPPVSSGPPA